MEGETKVVENRKEEEEKRAITWTFAATDRCQFATVLDSARLIIDINGPSRQKAMAETRDFQGNAPSGE